MPNPPQPTALKILSGSAKHDPQRLNRAEPHPAAGIANVPPWLPKAGPARSAWNRLLPILQQMHVVTQADAEALALGCVALDEYLNARKDDGSWRRADSAWKRYGGMLNWFGLTPSSRAKVQMLPVDKDDPLAAWAAK